MSDDAESDDADLDRAAAALADGDLVVYPTETVYGLGANAVDAAAVERVFEAKGRDRDNPVSLAVPDVEAALQYASPTAEERRFMHEFLPGPVTVVVERKTVVPDVLTAGRDRVGIRVPDHDLALALLERFEPITATSANVSGTGSVRELSELGEPVRAAAAVLLDGGRTPGGGSTVVDVSAGEIVRRGALADEIDAWL
ncbi:MAG: L-threonylcarbamoyladenylate synthase [Haloarculaceae archaeon]